MTTSLWSAIADAIRSDVEAGRTGPSGEIDTEAELCRRYAASRVTIRRALDELRSEGVLTARRGSGWCARRRAQPDAALVLRARAGREQPGQPLLLRSAVSVRRARPDAALSGVLRRCGSETAAAGAWLRCVFVLRADGRAVDATTIWFAPEVARRLRSSEVRREPPARLVSSLGIAVRPLAQIARAASCDVASARALGIEPGAPVLVVERVVGDRPDSPLVVTVHVSPADALELEVPLPISSDDGAALRLERRLPSQVGV